MNIPNSIADLGYFDITQYKLDSMTFLNSNLAIKFINTHYPKEGFLIKLENIVAYNDRMAFGDLKLIRLDTEGSTYGHDISIRLQDLSLQNYMVLYFFEDEKHTSFVFRALAKNISLENFIDSNQSQWPY